MNKATSVYLDGVRFLAACVVFFVHATYDRLAGQLPVVWRVAELGNDAVMVFFVLSGFVISYVADTKERTIGDYATSRAARLFSVAVPALLLTLACDAIGTRLSPALYDGWWYTADSPVWRTTANLLFLNELWFSSVRAFSNGPFWSLGYEVWYYAIFATVTYIRGSARYVWTGLACLVAGPKILLLLPVWLYGVFAYRLAKRDTIGPLQGLALAVASGWLYVAFRTSGIPGDLTGWTAAQLPPALFAGLGWSQDFLASNVLGALAALHFLGAARFLARVSFPFRLGAAIAHLASFTFSLYLFHYPLLQCLAAIADAFALPGRAVFITGGSIVAIALLGTVTERRKTDWRRALISGAALLRRAAITPRRL